jgi:restriction endonuclease S subunit
LEYGYTDTAKESGDTRFIRITDIDENGHLKTTEQKFINLTKESKPYLLNKNDLLVARTGATFGKTVLFQESYPAIFASYLIRLNFELNKILPNYYWAFAQSVNYWSQANSLMTGGGQQQFNANVIKKIKIPVPPMNEQKQIVAAIEAEQKIVQENKKLIGIFEQKIRDKIGEVWGE